MLWLDCYEEKIFFFSDEEIGADDELFEPFICCRVAELLGGFAGATVCAPSHRYIVTTSLV